MKKEKKVETSNEITARRRKWNIIPLGLILVLGVLSILSQLGVGA